jgi:hypothetical protein
MAHEVSGAVRVAEGQGPGNRDQGTGTREQGTGNRDQGIGFVLDGALMAEVGWQNRFSKGMTRKDNAKEPKRQSKKRVVEPGFPIRYHCVPQNQISY